ncbi:MAG: hypothetical protein ABI858_07670 [Pseudoxanthomonas sp.]
MFKHLFITLAMVVICSCATSSPSAPLSVRLDATSDASAKQSFERMLDQASGKKKQELAIAMFKLNMVGVKSAYEVVASPELQSLSITRIKDRVAGITADEIIDLANRMSEVKIEVQGK